MSQAREITIVDIKTHNVKKNPSTAVNNQHPPQSRGEGNSIHSEKKTHFQHKYFLREKWKL